MSGTDHNKLIGIFHLVAGGLQIFGAIFIGLIYGGMGFAFMSSARAEEQLMGKIFVVLALAVAPLIGILAVVSLIAGYKMLKGKASARTWGIVASIVTLPNVPLGTALGVYGLWFLFGEEGKRLYSTGGTANDFQPPPHNWQ